VPEQTNWRKSSYSNGGSGECVEVAHAADAVAVRDSKHATGPMITVAPAAWQAFLGTARTTA
jgi:hypothetical protein